MRTYSNPAVQIASDNIHNVVIPGFAQIAKDMQGTITLYGRREIDKSRPVELTQSQRETIEANRGKVIYGTSHPLYKAEG